MITRRMFVKALSAAAMVNPLNWWSVKAKAIPCKAKQDLPVVRPKVYPAFRILLDDGRIARVWGVAPADKGNWDTYFPEWPRLIKQVRNGENKTVISVAGDKDYFEKSVIEQAKRLVPEPVWGCMRYVEMNVENFADGWPLCKTLVIRPEDLSIPENGEIVCGSIRQQFSTRIVGGKMTRTDNLTIAWGKASDQIKSFITRITPLD